MSRLLGQLLATPLLIIGSVAAVVGWLSGDWRPLSAAGAALILVLPPGVMVLLCLRRPNLSPYSRVGVVLLGSLLRLLLGVGGGLLVYRLLRQTTGWEPLIFWSWLLGTYLVALTVETIVLAGYVRRWDGTGLGASQNKVPVYPLAGTQSPSVV